MSEEEKKEEYDGEVTELHYLNQKRYLKAEKMLIENFEPKRVFRWIFSVQGLDQFTLYAMQAPVWYKETGWTEFQVSMYDPVVPSTTQKVYEWLQSEEKRSATLVFLDPAGAVVEKWIYEDLEIQSARFGDLDYSKSDPKIINVCLKAAKIKLEF